MKKSFLVYVFAFLLFSALFAEEPEEEEKIFPSLLIIVDASRSMAQFTEDGETRMEVVKATAGRLAEGLHADVNVGMIFFGHRGGEYRHRDVEMVMPVGPLSTEVVKEELSLLQPTGLSPVALSLEEAARNLSVLEGRSCILLLSDGEDTCGGKPVETARRIKEEYGISVVIDVVGFNLTERALRQLSDIAETGGGRYHAINNSEEAAFFLTNIFEERIGGRAGERKEVRPLAGKTAEDRGKGIRDGEIPEEEYGSGTLTLHYGKSAPTAIFIYDQKTGRRTAGTHMWVHIQNKYRTHLDSGVYRLAIAGSGRRTLSEIRNVVIRAGRETSINIE